MQLTLLISCLALLPGQGGNQGNLPVPGPCVKEISKEDYAKAEAVLANVNGSSGWNTFIIGAPQGFGVSNRKAAGTGRGMVFHRGREYVILRDTFFIKCELFDQRDQGMGTKYYQTLPPAPGDVDIWWYFGPDLGGLRLRQAKVTLLLTGPRKRVEFTFKPDVWNTSGR